MATEYLIPTRADGIGHYQQRTRLDGVEYNLRFVWNAREERWYLDIRDDEESPLVTGIKLVTNWPLLRYHHWDDRVPPGELYVFTATDDESPPGLQDLGAGRRCELKYISNE